MAAEASKAELVQFLAGLLDPHLPEGGDSHTGDHRKIAQVTVRRDLDRISTVTLNAIITCIHTP